MADPSCLHSPTSPGQSFGGAGLSIDYIARSKLQMLVFKFSGTWRRRRNGIAAVRSPDDAIHSPVPGQLRRNRRTDDFISALSSVSGIPGAAS